MTPTPDKQPLKPKQIMENESSSVQEKSSVGLKPKLKPCPFCGSCAIVIHRDQDAKSHAPFEYYHWAECVKCGAESRTEDSHMEASASWRHRPRESELEAALLSAKEAFESAINGRSLMPMGGEFYSEEADQIYSKIGSALQLIRKALSRDLPN